MARSRKSQPVELIGRRLDDPNFAHVLRMFPLLRSWATNCIGTRIDFNARNMVQLPVEVAEAFIRERACDATELGCVCREVVAAIDDGTVAGLARLYAPVATAEAPGTPDPGAEHR